MTKTKTTDTATCQLCERTCKLVRGLISLHGYNRPGHGWIDGKCPGSKRKQWEIAHDVVDEYIVTCQARLAGSQAGLVMALEIQSNGTEVTEYQISRRSGESKINVYKRGERYPSSCPGMTLDMFAITMANRVQDLTSEIKQLEREIAKQTARVAAWVAA